jgi:hypothetical protein
MAEIMADTHAMRGLLFFGAVAFASTLTLVCLATPGIAAACSPPMERPTIRALGPGQIVVLGTVGERVAGGRLFHVERWFNRGPSGTPIVIAFKEGEPVGDCSYPVRTGERKIIAPIPGPNRAAASARYSLPSSAAGFAWSVPRSAYRVPSDSLVAMAVAVFAALATAVFVRRRRSKT